MQEKKLVLWDVVVYDIYYEILFGSVKTKKNQFKKKKTQNINRKTIYLLY